ncbi:hypothetical protein TNCV_4594511 [Trichonephila clavipes]|uniref:Uncharacterized protein n=1 Tax=Trichonephila clavipes TaxID=2585209 RepID=A0A8X7BKL8_TRICX|nr:hypothetical protein TNCV_4594511 [Trichonephila clavipes]
MTADSTGFVWCEGEKRILAYFNEKLRSRILVDQRSIDKEGQSIVSNVQVEELGIIDVKVFEKGGKQYRISRTMSDYTSPVKPRQP